MSSWQHPTDPVEYWRIGYCRRYGEYNKDVLVQYKYEVSIPLSRFKTVLEMREIEKYCSDNFGELDETSRNSSWQICSDAKNISGIQYCVLTFLFHNDDDAMAFKLRWV